MNLFKLIQIDFHTYPIELDNKHLICRNIILYQKSIYKVIKFIFTCKYYGIMLSMKSTYFIHSTK